FGGRVFAFGGRLLAPASIVSATSTPECHHGSVVVADEQLVVGKAKLKVGRLGILDALDGRHGDRKSEVAIAGGPAADLSHGRDRIADHVLERLHVRDRSAFLDAPLATADLDALGGAATRSSRAFEWRDCVGLTFLGLGLLA